LISSAHPSFEDRIIALNRIGSHVAANIFLFEMIDGFVASETSPGHYENTTRAPDGQVWLDRNLGSARWLTQLLSGALPGARREQSKRARAAETQLSSDYTVDFRNYSSSLSYGCRDALGRAGPYVADGEDTGATRLKR
jgi:hypothetical protein